MGIPHSDEIPYYVLQDTWALLLVLFAVTSALLFSRILVLYFSNRRASRLRVKKLSSCMITYMSINIVAVILQACHSIAYTTYEFTYVWIIGGDEIPIWNTILSWTDDLHFVTLYMLPLAVFFLVLERCLVVSLMTKYTPRLKFVLFLANAIGNPGKWKKLSLLSFWIFGTKSLDLRYAEF
ncbi:hypothetical protein Ddc_19113 [Ditylenchus destructor]|nr:hypothetical protein Ddc_19113 [Ditylenchus destructor]